MGSSYMMSFMVSYESALKDDTKEGKEAAEYFGAQIDSLEAKLDSGEVTWKLSDVGRNKKAMKDFKGYYSALRGDEKVDASKWTDEETVDKFLTAFQATQTTIGGGTLATKNSSR